MKKSLKKQIKEDEVVNWFEHGAEVVRRRGEELKVVLIVVLVLTVGAASLGYFRSQRDRAAREALTTALETFHAPTAAELGGAAAGARFATSAEKYRQALSEFEGVERRYGSHPLAVRARYYAALCKIELGLLDDAEGALKEIAASRNKEDLEPALARLALADLEQRKGQTDRAAETYKQIVDDPGSLVPRDHALMRMARTFESANKLPEARAAYQRLVQEFPASEYVAEAQRRAQYLQARG